MSRKSATIRVALVRAVPMAGNLAANWKTFERLARRAKQAKAQLCMSPECFLDGYAVARAKWHRQQLLAAGRTAAKQYLPKLKALARELEMTLCLGMTYSTGPRCFNSAFLIGPDGRLVGRYDKTHLLDHDRRFDPGRRLPVFNTPLGRLGILICADRRWPEACRALRIQGAQLMLIPTYGMSHQANDWWMRTRSYENECWVCFAHPELSLITDPSGNVHARVQSRRQGLLIGDLRMDNLPKKMFAARRPELYAAIARRSRGEH